jgi:hypothetical protein
VPDEEVDEEFDAHLNRTFREDERDPGVPCFLSIYICMYTYI